MQYVTQHAWFRVIALGVSWLPGRCSVVEKLRARVEVITFALPVVNYPQAVSSPSPGIRGASAASSFAFDSTLGASGGPSLDVGAILSQVEKVRDHPGDGVLGFGATACVSRRVCHGVCACTSIPFAHDL